MNPHEKLKVIQWGMGSVGAHAVTAVLKHAELELVGVWAHSPEKAGVDAGELVGLPTCGVAVTSDRDAIVSLDADCVFYAGRAQRDIEPVLDDICALLASGKNVVTTVASQLIYPFGLDDRAAARLQEACHLGKSSFHGTGVEPGWASEVLPLTVSGLMRRIDRLTVQEILDYSSYDNAAMLFGMMGFGAEPGDPSPFDSPELVLSSFKAPLLLLADGLGATIDSFTYHSNVAFADREIEIPAGILRKGTVAGRWFGVSAIIDGREALTVEHITRIGEDQAPDWPKGRGWRCLAEGEPSLRVEVVVGVNGEDENDQGCLATAMHAVNAIAPVCAAASGIRTFLDLPIITARGSLRGPPVRKFQ